MPRATRTAPALVLLVSCVCLLSLGCPPPRKSAAVKAEPGKQEPAKLADLKGGEAGRPKQTAAQFATQFLQAVTEGKAGPELLSVGLKKTLFPKARFADEEKLGYSDTDAKQWLRKPGNPAYSAPVEVARTKPVPHSVLTGTVKVGDQSQAYLLRVVPAADSPAGWVVDWFQQTRPVGTAAPAGDVDHALAQDSLQGFLDHLIGGELGAAAALMSVKARTALAPAVASSKEPYNPGYLDVQLLDRRGLYTGYRLAAPPAGGGSEYTFTVEFAGPRAGSVPVKVTKDPATGAWQVEGL